MFGKDVLQDVFCGEPSASDGMEFANRGDVFAQCGCLEASDGRMCATYGFSCANGGLLKIVCS